MRSEWPDVVQSVRLDGDTVGAKTCFLPLFLLFGLGATNRAQGAVRPGMGAAMRYPTGYRPMQGYVPPQGYRPMQGYVPPRALIGPPRALIGPPPIARPGLKPGGCG